MIKSRVYLNHQAGLRQLVGGRQLLLRKVRKRLFEIHFRARAGQNLEPRFGAGCKNTVPDSLDVIQCRIQIHVELVEGVLETCVRHRRHQPVYAGNCITPGHGISGARLSPVLHLGKLPQADHSLHLRHPPVGADAVMQPAKAGLLRWRVDALPVLAVILE
jgi:hypothetical protein